MSSSAARNNETLDILVVCAVFAVIVVVVAAVAAAAAAPSSCGDDDAVTAAPSPLPSVPMLLRHFHKMRFLKVTAAAAAAAVPSSSSPLSLINDGDDDNEQQCLSSSPPLRLGAAGIVMCAGGPTYTPLAHAAILSLRRTGCTLPVVVFHAGADEMGRVERQILARTPGVVDVVDAAAATGKNVKDVRGYQLKAVAVELSPFEHTVLLDADTLFFQDVSKVLSSAGYLATGAVFWPDMVPWNDGCIKRRAWRLLKVPPVKTERQQESSCVVVNKATSCVPLAYTYDMNQNHKLWYKYVHGDKDTWRFGFLTARRPYTMVPHPPGALGEHCRTFLQHDFEGRPLYAQNHKAPLPDDVVTMSRHTKWEIKPRNRFPKLSDSLVGVGVGADAAFVPIPPDMRAAIRAYNADLRSARLSYSAIPWVINRILLKNVKFPLSAAAPMGSFERYLEWENKLWRDADVERLLSGPDAILPELGLLDVYRAYTDKHLRAHLARYAVLYAEGGCYVDDDVTLLSSLTTFLIQFPVDTQCILFEKQNRKPSVVSSSFMLCAPHSEVARRVLVAHAFNVGGGNGLDPSVADAAAAADATLVVFVPSSRSSSLMRE